MPRDAAERGGDVDILQALVYVADKAFADRHHVLRLNKRHLEVDLGEFRLTVRAQIFVAKAAGHLHVAVEAREHQQLLVLLGRLRQREEIPREHARRHKVIAGALGSGFDEDRGLDLQKPVIVKVIAGNFYDLVALDDLVLHVGAAKIQVAVFQPQLFLYVGMLHNFKGRGFGLCENPQLLNLNFHVAGGQLGVFGGALAHYTAHREYIFRANTRGFFKNLPVGRIVKCQLQKAGAVAQIHKDQLP